MKKKFTKLLSCCLTGLLATTMIATTTGCGKEEDDPNIVSVYAWDSGWGVDGYQAIIDKFNEGDHPFTVKLEYTSAQESILTEFKSGTSVHDVFFCPVTSSTGYELMSDMNNILESKYGNESKTIGEKIGQARIDFMTDANGKVKSLPANSTSFSGIVYNKALFSQVGAEVPRTTVELQNLCEDLEFNTGAHKAFIHFSDGANGYYNYITYVWAAQYDGIESWNEYLQLPGDPAQIKARYTEKDGRYESLKAFSKCVNHNTVQRASNSSAFTTQQTAFLEGQAMMMVNGGWLSVEMSKNGRTFDGEKFSMMKTPVISSIIDVVPDQSIESDEELSALILAIDNGDTALTGEGYSVTQADYNRVKEARGMAYGGGDGGIFVPNYSSSVDYAKEFLRYFYSDEAGAIWRDLKHNDPVAKFSDQSYVTDYNYDAWSEFERMNKQLCFEETFTVGAPVSRSKLYLVAGAPMFPTKDSTGDYTKIFTSTNSADRIGSVDELWNKIIAHIESNWSTWAVSL